MTDEEHERAIELAHRERDDARADRDEAEGKRDELRDALASERKRADDLEAERDFLVRRESDLEHEG